MLLDEMDQTFLGKFDKLGYTKKMKIRMSTKLLLESKFDLYIDLKKLMSHIGITTEKREYAIRNLNIG